MGLDLILGGLVLIMTFQGWMKGFILQAIRLGGLVACVYLADPVRDMVKPYLLGHLPTIKPELVDRLLWWSSAVVSYLVLVGLANFIVRMNRRQPFGLNDPDRNDQFGGLMLGLAKGLVVAAFVTAGIERYALTYLKNFPQAEEHAKYSKALAWNEQYHPVARIWELPPVQQLVDHVQRMGLKKPSEPPTEPAPLRTAARPPRLEVPSAGQPDLDSLNLDPALAQEVEAIKEELRRAEPPR